MEIREVNYEDLEQLLGLYTYLHDNKIPVIDQEIREIWKNIIEDKNHHIVAGFVDGKLVSSCVLIIVPNLTHMQRPYGLIENVVTHEKYRGNGYALQVLNFAKEIAIKNNCYKLMLLTGTKEESTLRFYEKAGYNKNDKTGFIQWIQEA